MSLKSVNVTIERQAGTGPGGEMYLGDTMALLDELVARNAGGVQLIYLDPPFRTGQTFVMKERVGEKEWKSGIGTLSQVTYQDTMSHDEYMAMMRRVIVGARELLTDTGVIYLHADFRMHPHLRLLMDEVFGEANFLNEIIWSYQTGGRARRFYSRKHDVILFYHKGRKYYFDLDSVAVPRQDVRHNHMRRHVDADGRVYRSIKSAGKVYTYYDDEPAYPGDVWDDLSHLQQKDPQRTGYETQKPLRLLERVILSGTKKDDLICDLFAGSGTSLEAAWRNGRRFIGVDQSPFSLQTVRRRLNGASVNYIAPVSAGCPEAEAEVTSGIAYYDVTLTRYDIESGVCARQIAALDGVDNWAVGYLRDGAFRVYASDFRMRTKPRLKTTLQLPVLAGVPCLRVGDVLGRHFYYALPIGAEGV